MERRIFDRFNLRFPAKFNHIDNDFGEKVYLMNISAQGANILSNHFLAKDDVVTLTVQVPKSQPMKVCGRVVWVRNKSDLWDAGMKFDDIELMRISRLYKYADSNPLPS